jgi:hypothetical protein
MAANRSCNNKTDANCSRLTFWSKQQQQAKTRLSIPLWEKKERNNVRSKTPRYPAVARHLPETLNFDTAAAFWSGSPRNAAEGIFQTDIRPPPRPYFTPAQTKNSDNHSSGAVTFSSQFPSLTIFFSRQTSNPLIFSLLSQQQPCISRRELPSSCCFAPTSA